MLTQEGDPLVYAVDLTQKAIHANSAAILHPDSAVVPAGACRRSDIRRLEDARRSAESGHEKPADEGGGSFRRRAILVRHRDGEVQALLLLRYEARRGGRGRHDEEEAVFQSEGQEDQPSVV